MKTQKQKEQKWREECKKAREEYPKACGECLGSGHIGHDICDNCVEKDICPRCSKTLYLREDKHYDYYTCKYCNWDELKNCEEVLPFPPFENIKR